MTVPKLVAHCLVRNEEKWIWYALISVLDYVDEIIVWDNGSVDSTPDLVKSISSPKIKFRQRPGASTQEELTKIRNEMLKTSKHDWLMILDGDEVWPDQSIKKVMEFIKTDKTAESIVVPTLNCVGDVYHISPPSAGKYRLAGRVGHLTIRFISKAIPGLHLTNLPGQTETFLDAHNRQIQDRPSAKIVYLDTPYFHMTHLDRSNSRQADNSVFWRATKRKYDLGIPIPKNIDYPKCFYFPHPPTVANPWKHRSLSYILNASWQTPLKLIKRQLIK